MGFCVRNKPTEKRGGGRVRSRTHEGGEHSEFRKIAKDWGKREGKKIASSVPEERQVREGRGGKKTGNVAFSSGRAAARRRSEGKKREDQHDRQLRRLRALPGSLRGERKLNRRNLRRHARSRIREGGGETAERAERFARRVLRFMGEGREKLYNLLDARLLLVGLGKRKGGGKGEKKKGEKKITIAMGIRSRKGKKKEVEKR